MAVALEVFNSFLHLLLDDDRSIEAAAEVDFGDRLIEDLKDPWTVATLRRERRERRVPSNQLAQVGTIDESRRGRERGREKVQLIVLHSSRSEDRLFCAREDSGRGMTLFSCSWVEKCSRVVR